MTETNTTQDELPTTDDEQTEDYAPTGKREAQMSQFAAVSGLPVDDGFRFQLTKPLSFVGINREDLQGDTDAMLYFADPDPDEGVLTATLAVGEGLPGGRRDSRFRRIYDNGSSLIVYLTTEQIEAIGIDVEGSDEPPILDVWASEEGIAFRKLDVRQVMFEHEMEFAVEALPDQMRQDYLAVEEGGYTPAEWAKERGLTPMEEAEGVFDPAEYVRRNYEAAKKRIEAAEDNA